MNELMKVHRTSINAAPQSSTNNNNNNMMRPDLLFSEDFLKNYKGADNGLIMGGPVISQRNNENMKVVGSDDDVIMVDASNNGLSPVVN